MDRIVEMFRSIPKRLRKTFTFDNGSEFYYFKILERELKVTVYYADPYNSGQSFPSFSSFSSFASASNSTS